MDVNYNNYNTYVLFILVTLQDIFSQGMRYV